MRPRSSMNSASAPAGSAPSGTAAPSASPPSGSGTAASWAGVHPSNSTSANGPASRSAALPLSDAGPGSKPGTGVP